MFGGFARDMLTPRVSSAFEKLMIQPNSSAAETPEEPNLSLSSFQKKDSAYNFKIYLNVNQFDAADVSVNRVQDNLVIRAQHDLKPDEHGYVSREFTRRIKLPEDIDVNSITSIFTRNGMLVIKAVKKTPVSPPDAGVEIPVKIQQPLESATEDESVREKDRRSSPTGTEYIVREVL